MIKPPPFLIGASILFWGWQTDFLLPALLMALVLESPRWTKLRWELADEDFRRIWVFCTLLLLGSAIYAFSANEGPADFRGLFQNPNFATQRNVGTASAKTAVAIIRWLPMIFFLFIAAQEFSSREGIPMETISLILRRRWRRARKAGLPKPASQVVNIAYPFFGICLLAASAHNRDDGLFFWGVCALLGWALWSQRSRRFGVALWVAALVSTIALGYSGQRQISHLQHYLEGINAQWLAGFTRRGVDPNRSRTGLGQIGRIKTSAKIVIRLETQEKASPPPLLREASYRTYKAETWYSGNAKNEPEAINASQTNKETWVLLPGKTNIASVNIACYLETVKRSGGVHAGLLPLASGSGMLEHLPAYLLHKNKAGAILAEGPGLVMFEDFYAPGETIDSPPEYPEDYHVSDRESKAVEKVIDGLHLEGKSHKEKLRSIRNFFQTEFSYRTWQDQNRSPLTNETALARFLLRTRSGHCEYFATATALLLRKLDIPTRYAVGYAVHEASGTKYVVRQRDAHAWCLVWNDGERVWEDFDTTPGSWLQAETGPISPWQFFSDAWSRLGFEVSKLRWGQTHLRQYLLWFLAPVLGILLFQIISRSRRKREAGRMETSRTAWPGLDSEFYQLERHLVARGLNRKLGEPLSEWLARSSAQAPPRTLDHPLQELLYLHYRYRFDPNGLNSTQRELLRQRAQECIARVGQS